MEAYSTSSSSSSSSSSPMNLSPYPREEKSLKQSQSFHSSLHSVRKSQVKPWKKPIAPLIPTPPRVYKVDPTNFRDLVQKLTGAPESIEQSQPEQHRLQRVAPPPLDLDKQPALFSREFAAAPLRLCNPSPVKNSFSAFYQELMADTPDQKRKISESVMASSSLELNLLSPSTHVWCSFPLLSPGTLSSLEQSTVL